MDKIYELSMNMNVLNHLGINLYSSIPAVLSEVVANSWDADAEEVEINIDEENDIIIIQDNGEGMDYDDLQSKYLNVGYMRRINEAVTSKHERKVMGRKGIGKLALMSIANNIEIQSMKNTEKNGFVINTIELKKVIEEEKENYKPRALSEDQININKVGTKIILSDLKKKQLWTAKKYLKRRIARRFSVIGEKHSFKVSVNGEEITIEDRDYSDKIECLWVYGKDSEFAEKCNEAIITERDSDIEADGNLSVEGWIGTVKKSGDLKDSEGNDNLNKISVLIRGKVALENILDFFNEGGLYSKYLIGEIRADFLDDDDDDDITTSSRQGIKEDSERFIKLKAFLFTELKNIQGDWTYIRNSKGAEEITESFPVVDQWYRSLGPDGKRKAEKLFGKINELALDEEGSKELVKNSVLAFERLSIDENLDMLDAVDESNLGLFTTILGRHDELEASMFWQIINERLKIIVKLKNSVEDNALEKVIQTHIFDHLWLLDPSWDKASEDRTMETRMKDLVEGDTVSIPEDVKNSRLDIKYRKASAGLHTIIELKRPDVVVEFGEISTQINKYTGTMRKIIEETGVSEAVQAVCLVGRIPRGWDNAETRRTQTDALKMIGIRVMTYSDLIDSAETQYRKFLTAHNKAARLYELTEKISDSLS